jgi:hypothetical protein
VGFEPTKLGEQPNSSTNEVSVTYATDQNLDAREQTKTVSLCSMLEVTVLYATSNWESSASCTVCQQKNAEHARFPEGAASSRRKLGMIRGKFGEKDSGQDLTHPSPHPRQASHMVSRRVRMHYTILSLYTPNGNTPSNSGDCARSYVQVAFARETSLARLRAIVIAIS